MMKKLLTVQALLIISFFSFSQSIGIGTTAPDASAVLDVTHISKGLLIPRMSTASLNAIAQPARGLLVYDSSVNILMVNIGTPQVPNWTSIGQNGWQLSGNNIAPEDFFGTLNNQPLRFRVNNQPAGELNPTSGNILLGVGAGLINTNTYSNVIIGAGAMPSNTQAPNTVAIGDSALFHNGTSIVAPTDAMLNTAVGSKTLFKNNTGNANTAIGYNSLLNNTDGSFNLAAGAHALFRNTLGRFNTATGNQALFNNTTANINTATGYKSLFSNTTGFANTATGANTLEDNLTGFDNTAIGFAALNENTTADSNTAIGRSSLIFNTTGQANTAVGTGSLFLNITGNYNTAVGANAGASVQLGERNTMIGANAGATIAGTTNSVAIGANSVVTASNQVRLGNINTTSIGGQVGFSSLSDGRYKRNIRESVTGIDFIMKLRPVTYQLDVEGLNKKLNAGAFNPRGDQTIYSGFIAQEVEQAAKKSGYPFSGIDKPANESGLYGLRYSDFVVPLVKAVQEQQALIQQLQKEIAELKKRTPNSF